MNDRNLLRGLFLTAIALAFGLSSLHYTIGRFSNPGPGLFPLLVSGLLLLIGLASAVRSRFGEPVRLKGSLKNIAVILLSLIGFAEISMHLDVIFGITFLVFCSSLASTSFSLARNLKVSVGLIAIAFALHKLLGLNLPLL